MSEILHRPSARLGVEQLESRDTPTTVSFVTHLYQDILARQPDAPGFNFWVNRIDSGAVSTGQVAVQFIASQEYRTNAIVSYYQTQLGRAPNAAEIQSYLNLFVTGASQDAIRASFFASDEFFARYGRDNSLFVIQLYSQILGRTASVAEVSSWVNVLNQSGGNRTAVVIQFLGSLEYFQFEVNFAYTNLLHRAPDPNGQTFWEFQRASGMTVETLDVNFLASVEYFNRT